MSFSKHYIVEHSLRLDCEIELVARTANVRDFTRCARGVHAWRAERVCYRARCSLSFQSAARTSTTVAPQGSTSLSASRARTDEFTAPARLAAAGLRRLPAGSALRKERRRPRSLLPSLTSRGVRVHPGSASLPRRESEEPMKDAIKAHVHCSASLTAVQRRR